MEGVVRAPSLFSMTFGVLPSMMATQEFVVPRSMPMIRPMMFSPCSGPSRAVFAYVRYLWIRWVGFKLDRVGSFELFRRRHGDEGRPQDAVRDEVALLQHADDRVGFLWRAFGGRDHRDRLVLVRVELRAGLRVDLDDLVAFERALQLAQGDFGAFADLFDRPAFVREAG